MAPLSHADLPALCCALCFSGLQSCARTSRRGGGAAVHRATRKAVVRARSVACRSGCDPAEPARTLFPRRRCGHLRPRLVLTLGRHSVPGCSGCSGSQLRCLWRFEAKSTATCSIRSVRALCTVHWACWFGVRSYGRAPHDYEFNGCARTRSCRVASCAGTHALTLPTPSLGAAGHNQQLSPPRASAKGRATRWRCSTATRRRNPRGFRRGADPTASSSARPAPPWTRPP